METPSCVNMQMAGKTTCDEIISAAIQGQIITPKPTEEHCNAKNRKYYDAKMLNFGVIWIKLREQP